MALGLGLLVVVAAGIATSAGVAFACLVWSYKRSLEREEDAWWLKGEKGKARGSLLLRTLFWLASKSPATHDAQMADEAEAKAKLLVNADGVGGALQGGVCFIGSSTFTFWTRLEDDMREAGITDAKCFNAAFGGACTRHVNAHIEALCLRFRPKVVVYFCGTNDINLDVGYPKVAPPPAVATASAPVVKQPASSSSSCDSGGGCGGAGSSGRSGVAVVHRDEAHTNFLHFVGMVKAALPGCRVVLLAATVTPLVVERQAPYVERFFRHNRLARDACVLLGGVEIVEQGDFQLLVAHINALCTLMVVAHSF